MPDEISPIPDELERRKLTEERFWSNVNKDGPIPERKPELGQCWIWKGAHAGEYAVFQEPFTNHQIRGSRFAWELENQPMEEHLFACHHCDNRGCVRPSHIFPGTQKQNMQDALTKGRMQNCFDGVVRAHQAGTNRYCRGEAMPNSKLSNESVIEMRRLHDEEGWGYKKLKKRFGVSAGLCKRIVKRITWTHI